MATQIDTKELDLQEQMARIRQMIEESDRRRAESEQRIAEREKIMAETKILPASTVFQAMLATAALLGAGQRWQKCSFRNE